MAGPDPGGEREDDGDEEAGEERVAVSPELDAANGDAKPGRARLSALEGAGAVGGADGLQVAAEVGQGQGGQVVHGQGGQDAPHVRRLPGRPSTGKRRASEPTSVSAGKSVVSRVSG